MRRFLRIAGYAVLIIAGVVIAATVEIWPLVWVVGFPLAYVGRWGYIRNGQPGRLSQISGASDFVVHS